ncbi:uncharacterized protein LOC135146334 isoform X2 [Zophobas morio]|uniref:uncharacterized protein LOC135146334 isoform X2 n=2 Tax=Zophobas morio TaxID=2755281 RepID=UPI00308328A4
MTSNSNNIKFLLKKKRINCEKTIEKVDYKLAKIRRNLFSKLQNSGKTVKLGNIITQSLLEDSFKYVEDVQFKLFLAQQAVVDKKVAIEKLKDIRWQQYIENEQENRDYKLLLLEAEEELLILKEKRDLLWNKLHTIIASNASLKVLLEGSCENTYAENTQELKRLIRKYLSLHCYRNAVMHHIAILEARQRYFYVDLNFLNKFRFKNENSVATEIRLKQLKALPSSFTDSELYDLTQLLGIYNAVIKETILRRRTVIVVYHLAQKLTRTALLKRCVPRY